EARLQAMAAPEGEIAAATHTLVVGPYLTRPVGGGPPPPPPPPPPGGGGGGGPPPPPPGGGGGGGGGPPPHPAIRRTCAALETWPYLPRFRPRRRRSGRPDPEGDP
ncbi:hypothetical protein QO017_005656, partial [Methylobacterium gregans]|nr:hypothetical protein [Methylobacterium gregans]